MMIKFMAVALLLMSLSTAAVAQDPRLNRLDPEARAGVAAILDSARSAGLPTEPLLDRALEGAAKRAPAPAIVAAVQRLAAQLEHARAILGPRASAAELEAGAAALRAGADSTVLHRLRSSRPQDPLTVPLAVLADLVAQGVPPDTAASAVLALTPVTSDDELIEFRRSVERDIGLGAPPAAAASVRANSATDYMYQPGASGQPRPPSQPRRP
jgi:hypothetical protein